MRAHRRSVEDIESVYAHALAARHDRRCPVRISIVGPELIVLVALLVIGGLVAGIFQDGRPLRHSAGSSLRGHDKFVGTLCYGADGRTLLTSGWDRQVRIWKVDEVQSDGATEIQSLPHDWHVYSIAVSPDGKYLAAGGVGGFSIWSWRDGLEWRRVKDQKGVSCRMLTISPDGRTLALACTDLTIRLWDLAAMAELRKLRDVSGELRSIAFSPEGALLAASTFSGNLRIWDLAAMNPEPIASRIPGSVRSFAFVPGSRSLAIADSGCEGNCAVHLGRRWRRAAIQDRWRSRGKRGTGGLARRQDPRCRGSGQDHLVMGSGDLAAQRLVP